MDVEVLSAPGGAKGELWRALLARVGLEADSAVEETALLWDGGTLAAAASRQGFREKTLAASRTAPLKAATRQSSKNPFLAYSA